MVMIMMAIMTMMMVTTRLLMSTAGYKRVERRQLTADGIAFPLRLTSPLLLGWSIARIVMMWWSSYDGNGDDHHQHQIGDHHHPKYIVMVDVREHPRWSQWSLNDKMSWCWSRIWGLYWAEISGPSLLCKKKICKKILRQKIWSIATRELINDWQNILSSFVDVSNVSNGSNVCNGYIKCLRKFCKILEMSLSDLASVLYAINHLQISTTG